jgi:hypothetical protein
MAVIDIPTFLLALGIGNVGFAVLMAGYNHGAKPNPGLTLWMWARFGMGLSQLLGWAQPHLLPPFFAGLEGLGWILAVSLEVAAYCIFFGFQRWGRILLPITVLSSSLVLAASLLGASQTQLSSLVAGVVALFAATMSWILLRPRRAPHRSSLLQQIIGINDGLFAAAVALWAVSELGRGSASPGGMQAFA